MSYTGETAFISGGTSNVAQSLALAFAKKGLKIVLADHSLDDVASIAKDLNAKCRNGKAVSAVQVDIGDWESQRTGFASAVSVLDGRVDYVFAIAKATEGQWLLESDADAGTSFQKPDLSTFHAGAYESLYTSGLAIQQFRRQAPNKYGFRGKLIIVSSSLGFYSVPSLPMYTAAQHCVVAFARTFGRYLPREHITLNTMCPNHHASSSESEIASVTAAAESLMGPSKASGDAVEILPDSGGYRVKEIPAFTNEVARESIELATAPEHRAWQFHAPVEE